VPYQVRDWGENFENAKSRERVVCSWVPMPNKQSGLGLSRILTEPDGAAIYGIWCLIVGAVSRQKKPRDGWLTADGHQAGTPWAPDDLALMFRRPLEEVERALAVLSSDPVGWLEVSAECPPATRKVPAECPPATPSEKGRKEEKEEKYSVKARAVFDHWVSVMGKNKATKFPSTSKRYRAVIARLKEGYTVKQLCLAVDGCRRTPHNMGQNDRNQKFNDLELICRSVENVERFMERATVRAPAGPLSSDQQRLLDQQASRERRERDEAEHRRLVAEREDELIKEIDNAG